MATRSEFRWLGAVAVIAAAAYATTIATHVDLGDAPESVAGISSVSLLHDPGYAVYVLVAKAFTLVVPFGSLTFRVNVFSTLCAVLVVVATYGIARRVGAHPAGAAVGALTFAFGTSFWFHAGYAKHVTFSTLLVAGALLLALEWDARGDRRFLIGSGVALGLTLGASWQLAVTALPALATLVLWRRTGAPGRSRLRAFAVLALSGIVAADIAIGATLLTARQDSAINWGGATTVGRVAHLVTMQDFAGVPKARPGEEVQPQVRHFPGFRRLAGALTQQLPLTGLLVAGWGALASRWRATARHARFVLLGAAAAFVAVAWFLGNTRGQYVDVPQVGSRLTPLLVLLAACIALGFSDLVERRLLRGAGAWLVAGAVLIPALAGHWSPASHHQPRFADLYAKDVFASLPRRSVLFVGGAELAFPFWYRQELFNDRPDVDVVTLDQLDQDWYREQVKKQLGVAQLPLSPLLMRQLVAADRPVYLDWLATERLRGRVGLRAEGLVNAFDSRPSGLFASPEELQKRTRAFDPVIYSRAAHRWPNRLVLAAYRSAHVVLARAEIASGRRAEANAQLRLALRVYPADPVARALLGPGRKAVR